MATTKKKPAGRSLSSSDQPLYQFDPGFVKRIKYLLNPLEKYFRYEVHGLNNIPKKGAALVVMNHGVIPYHGFLFAKKLVEDLKVFPRGLGASFLFELPWIREIFLRGGAVKANPHNAKKLLAEGNLVMLSPGGIYEALIARKGLRRIPWERRKGFVRLAVETGTPIVPTYCNGINAAYFNSYFLLKPRIKLLEKTRFSMPFFFGLGLLPFPAKLVHRVGKPVRITKKAGESTHRQIERIHREVVAAVTKLARAQQLQEE
jgi:1-acyl-sn-glycerol-3-phosphate acyltransferase